LVQEIQFIFRVGCTEQVLVVGCDGHLAFLESFL
jgi:hypothetical protein